MQMMILQYQKRNNKKRRLAPPVPPVRQKHWPQIPYNPLNRFTFVGINKVLCYSLNLFYPGKIQRLLPLLSLHKIQFRARCTATPEEVFAVVFIQLSYPIYYWNMMDRFGYSRTWLSIVFNDTIIHIKKQVAHLCLMSTYLHFPVLRVLYPSVHLPYSFLNWFSDLQLLHFQQLFFEPLRLPKLVLSYLVHCL